MATETATTEPATQPAETNQEPAKPQQGSEPAKADPKPAPKQEPAADDGDDGDSPIGDPDVISHMAHKKILAERTGRLKSRLSEREAVISEREAALQKTREELLSLRSRLEEREHELGQRDALVKGLTTDRDALKARLTDFQTREFESLLGQIEAVPDAHRDVLKAALADEINAKDGAALAKRLPALLKLVAPAGKTGAEPLAAGGPSEPRFQGRPVRLLRDFHNAVMRGGAEEQSAAASALGLSVAQASQLLARYDAAKK